jgi:hypothetical protein
MDRSILPPGIRNANTRCWFIVAVIEYCSGPFAITKNDSQLSAARRKYGDVSGEGFSVQARREEGACPYDL